MRSPGPGKNEDGTFFLFGQVISIGTVFTPRTFGIAFVRGRVVDTSHNLSWDAPQLLNTFGTILASTFFLERLAMEVDPETSRIHLLYLNTLPPDPPHPVSLWHQASADGGDTWSTPLAVGNDSLRASFAPAILCGKNAGKVSLFWEEADGDYVHTFVRSSTDGGVTLMPAATVMTRPNLFPECPTGDVNASIALAVVTDRSDGPWEGYPVVGAMTAMNLLSDVFPPLGSVPDISEVEPNDTPAAAADVGQLSVVLRGDVGSPSDVDYYRFALFTGLPISAWIDSVSSANDLLSVEWMGPDGTVQVTGNGSWDDRLGFTAPSDGTYFLRVRGGSSLSSGPYRIRTTLATTPYPGAFDQRDVALSLGDIGGTSWTGLQLMTPSPPVGYDGVGLNLTWNADGYLYASWTDFAVSPARGISRRIIRRSSDAGATWSAPATLSAQDCNWEGVPGFAMGARTGVVSNGVNMVFAWADGRNGDIDVYARGVERRVELADGSPFTASSPPGQTVDASRVIRNVDDVFPFVLRLEGSAVGRNWGALPITLVELAAGQTSPLNYAFTVPDTAAPGPVQVVVSYRSALPPYALYASAALQLTVTTLVDVAGSPATEMALGLPSPNPARGQIRFAYSLSRPGRAEMSIYTVDGRCVRRLNSGEEAAGSHSRAWDGTDDRGSRVSSGAYFVKLVAEGQSIVRRFVWMR